ncbi:esterase FE4-like [Danaus plexippus]|uniref:esterase FE4-like n=1 Tax=Danaus plexippus TaxID=13037 RepID=UPI002AAFC055|nr:esterase FE4-like [Danaus plexippus]
MFSFLAWSVLSALFLSVIAKNQESRLIKIHSGPVRGYKDPLENVFTFHGIPYATAPTGTQRFKGPLPPPVWTEILEAVNKSIVCPQMYMNVKENCLTASVYVPENVDEELPVVVYIHGGGFVLGFGDVATPKKLVSSQHIIAVTFNYRLGAHGFLCLGTEDIPGNAGMKDQVALLRWVKQNIAWFGGNPEDITIAGYSAGSSSVELLMISKMGVGLFNKVILESGASTSPYAIQVDPIQNAKEYANLIQKINISNVLELEQYFKNIPYELLQSGDLRNRKDHTFLFSPCVETDNGQERFLDDNPVNILKQGNYSIVPMLYGFTNMEGLMRISTFDLWKTEMQENFSNFLPADLRFENDEVKHVVAENIKKFYFGDKPVNDDTVLNYVDYISDVTFTCPVLRAIQFLLNAGHDKIYLYEYSFTDENTPFVPYTHVRGADHCAQTSAVLDGFEGIKSSDTEDYVQMRSIMRELWGNFIKHRKPSASEAPAWSPVSKNRRSYMALKKYLELKESLLEKPRLFWDQIYDLYYRFPVAPSK